MIKKLTFLIFVIYNTIFANDKFFVFVIPSYNNSEIYLRNLDSVFSQTYKNFRVIYVDDASPDGTGALVQSYIEKNHLSDRVTLIRNAARIGTLANVYQAVWLCEPDEIVVDLDGDDWLADNEVLSLLNEVYKNDFVWLTYGQCLHYPRNEVSRAWEITTDLIDQNAFRSIYATGTTPLRTFYAGLFQQINRDDLFYNGKFLHVTSDLAFMFPMLEMAGHHIKFIPQVLYIYNSNIPTNDHRLRAEEQLKMDAYLRGKEKYSPVKHYNPLLK